MAVVILLKIFSFFFLRFPDVFALNFNLPAINPDDLNRKINVSGDAYITQEGIQVTPNERSEALDNKTGRATYVDPLHLWDKASGNLADFTTHFSFTIDSSNSSNYGDGLAFFLAPTNSSIPETAKGSGLGLRGGNMTENNTADPFVAVEFDTYPNAWDPPYTHVGININSMNSVNSARWWNDIALGATNDAWISYNATSQNLAVNFTVSDNSSTPGSLNYVVDLRHYLPEFVTFGFSAATGASFEKNNVKSWEFNSSLQVALHPQEPTPSPSQNPTTVPQEPTPSPNQSSTTGKKKSKAALVIGLSVGLPVLILGLTLFSYVRSMKNKKEQDHSHDLFMDNEFERGTGPKKLTYNELARATNNFDEGEKLGEGGFGGVYRGFLRDGNMYVAVKKVSKESKQGPKEYASEVKIISQLRHRNLVQLIGWCHDKGELLLVYEYMPNGSLDSHLFNETSQLTWAVRYKIAQGVASALLYLHEEWEQCVVHRDIKSSNIMLDSSFNAKLGDFGLARLVDHGKGSQTTDLAGTMGYMAPEYLITGKASKESDVYSFGMVALEIASGRRPINNRAQDQARTVEWVWDLYGRGKLSEAADPKLRRDFDEQEMERLMVVALWCAHPDSNLRPSIRQAIHVLNFEAELPILPSKMPVPTYPAPAIKTQEYN